jgi:peptide/nickel transport system permease protein
MSKLIWRRLALGVLTLWLISLIVFAAVLALPGDAATAILGKEATPDRVAALRDQLNLNDSVVSQYLQWIGGVVTGSFGESAATQQPVSELLSERVGNSLFLVLIASLVAIPLSIALGVWLAMKRDRPADHIGSTVSLVLAALPEFVIGIGLVLLFATSVFQWFPAVSLLAPGERAWEAPKYVVLPAATLVLAVTPYISRIMRGSMIEVLESEYVTMARLKGLSERTVIWRDPGRGAPARVDGGRRRGRRVRVLVSGHRPRAGRGRREPRHAGRPDGRDARRGGLRADEPRRGPRDDPRYSEAEDRGAMSNPAIDSSVDVGLEAAVERVTGAAALQRRPWLGILRNALRLGRTQIGVAIVALLLAIALFGPLVAPHSPTEFVAVPNTGPSSDALFGADALGRDVLSRFLHGGLSVLWMAASATLIGVIAGVGIGLVAAYSRGWVDDVLMRASDVVLAFPQIILALLAVSAIGSKLWLIVLVVAVGHIPRVARVMRGAAQEVVERDFVKAAEAVGEKRSRIVFGELLPNVTSPLLVELGLRMTYSIGLVAAVSFLGFGLQPPSSDWGLMINENRLSITVQPWAVLLPVLAIGLLTVGTNLITDGIARAAIGIDRRAER